VILNNGKVVADINVGEQGTLWRELVARKALAIHYHGRLEHATSAFSQPNFDIY
jgi:hypothetical protein